MLDIHQVRGAVASWTKLLESDLKSVAASGWGPELIPEEDILLSQFPDVLEQIEKDEARISHAATILAAGDRERRNRIAKKLLGNFDNNTPPRRGGRSRRIVGRGD